MVERYSRGSPYAIHHASRGLGERNDPTLIRPAEISAWLRPDWTSGRRPPTVPLLHNVMPVHGPANVWHMKIEINNDCWDWWAAPNDAISGPFQLTIKVPDLSGRDAPTALERFLDQEIGL